MQTRYWTVQLEVRFDEAAVARATVADHVHAATAAYRRSVNGEQPGRIDAEVLIGPTLVRDRVAEYVRARLEHTLAARGVPLRSVTVGAIRPR